MDATPFKSIVALRASIVAPTPADPAWCEKMLHHVPELPVVKDRAAYLVEKAKGKIVLDIGCTGPISKAIKAVAAKYYGVDQVPVEDGLTVDVDAAPEDIPVFNDVDIIILSEVLEHLANPGAFLAILKDRYDGTETFITVPNAGAYAVQNECEIVNKDHVAWYSYTTLKNLLTRYGFQIKYARWYNGLPHKAEGLIFVVT